MRLEHSLVIHRPVADVFAFVADPDNLPQWQSGLLEVEKLSGDGGLGSRHREVRSMLGRRIEQVLEVTALTPDERLDFEVVEVRCISPSSTRSNPSANPLASPSSATATLAGSSRSRVPLVARAVRKQSESDFARLRAVLETCGA